MPDKNYCYPNSDVLINKLDLRDAEMLSHAERKITALNDAAIRTVPVKGAFDFKHLLSIHKYLFSDLYTWAGSPRLVDIAKGNCFFSKSVFIASNAEKIFGDIKQENFLIGLPKEKAIERLAYFMGELNALHPFREGNGRTQRIFIGYLANATGIALDWTKVNREHMINASIHSMYGDNSMLTAMLNEISKPLSIAEQYEFLKSISKAGTVVFDNCSSIPDRIIEFTNDDAVSLKKPMRDVMANAVTRCNQVNEPNNSKPHNKGIACNQDIDAT